MRRLFAFLFAVLLALPATALAANDAQNIEGLRKQVKELNHRLNEISGRVDKNEVKRAIDHFNWYGDMRVKADTLHYSDLTVMNPNTGKMEKHSYDNDILYTTRLRLSFRAKVYKNVRFSARLTMYKNWGDSTGVQVFDGFNSVTMDGTDSGNTTGDWLRVERAYFAWSHIGGSPFYLSIGRRPSTYGPPTQFRENEPRGGTPSGQVVNFDFDGITIGYSMSKLTGVDGQVLRFCYGQGYESQLGNGSLLTPETNLRDTHLGGFDFDILNDGTTFLQATAFEALDVTDGFKGLAVLPMINGFTQPNTNGFISRLQATENIGNMTLANVTYSRQEMSGLDWFVALGWTRSDPNGRVSQMGFGGLLTDTPGDTTARNGFSVYAGFRIPAPLGKFGLEYNWGSKYWTPFTQAQDDIVGSKLAARGQVGEIYYIFDINPKMFIKLSGLYYDYAYTGSGSPVGKPEKISDVQANRATSLFPVIDKVFDGNVSMTVKF
jgi:hypothetical protein